MNSRLVLLSLSLPAEPLSNAFWLSLSGSKRRNNYLNREHLLVLAMHGGI